MSDSPKFSVGEEQTLRIIVSHIIPASAAHDMPGADDELIFADIRYAARREEPAIREAVATVDRMTGGRLAELSRSEQAELLARFRSQHPLLARSCEIVTARCYYRDDRVMRAIGMEVRPPFPLGFKVEPGELDLLEPVRKRGKIYRDA